MLRAEFASPHSAPSREFLCSVLRISLSHSKNISAPSKINGFLGNVFGRRCNVFWGFGRDFCSLGREFLRPSIVANFSFNGSKTGIVLPTLPRCVPTLPRCQRCVSTIHVCRKYIVNSILKIMINRNLFFYYYTPYATQATAQRATFLCIMEERGKNPEGTGIRTGCSREREV